MCLSGKCLILSQVCDEPKPSHSYIGLIAMAILSAPERKMVLSEIYQWILTHYHYFRCRGPGWRNSIRHNLSLNDCFVKAGRSANGKGHYWAIHPANVDDFQRGDFRRRRAQRKVIIIIHNKKRCSLVYSDCYNYSKKLYYYNNYYCNLFIIAVCHYCSMIIVCHYCSMIILL